MQKSGLSAFLARRGQALSRIWQQYGGLDLFRNIGERTLNTISRLGRATLFLYETVVGMTYLVPRFSLVVQQVFNVGVLTLLIILVSGLGILVTSTSSILYFNFPSYSIPPLF